MPAAAPELIIDNLRGGMNETDPAFTLKPNQCPLARNIEYFLSACGERRLGCGPLSLTGSTLATQTVPVFAGQWLPDNDVLNPEFIAFAATPSVSVVGSARTNSVWADLTFTDAPVNTAPSIYSIRTAPLNLALYIAYTSGVDRLHAKDAGNLNVRRAGLAQAAVGSAANTGGAGSYPAILRYYRWREVVQVAGVTTLRGEPSPSTAFTPDGAHASATFTRGAPSGDGATHWELEDSPDGANFYRQSTIAIATATYVDTAAPASYAATGILSEDIGEYLPFPAVKYVMVEGDRLIGAGHCTDVARASDVVWSPVSNDPGVGNAERLPLSENNKATLDNHEGAGVTGLDSVVTGSFIVFKWQGVYRFVRTGDPTNAYDVICVSKTIGAIPGSIVRGIDPSGASCIFFLDPYVGMCMIGQGGVQRIWGLRNTWRRVNLQAGNQIAVGCYYPDKQQVRWCVAVDGSYHPNFGITVQTTELTWHDNASMWGGVSVWDGHITEAYCMGVLTELVNIGGYDQVSNRPFVGLLFPDGLQRCDTESTDAGVAYTATIRTRPLALAGLLQRFGVLVAAVAATANAGTSMVVRLVRDFNKESNPSTANLTPEGSETYVIKVLDDLVMSEMTTVQMEFTDG